MSDIAEHQRDVEEGPHVDRHLVRVVPGLARFQNFARHGTGVSAGCRVPADLAISFISCVWVAPYSADYDHILERGCHALCQMDGNRDASQETACGAWNQKGNSNYCKLSGCPRKMFGSRRNAREDPLDPLPRGGPYTFSSWV